MTRIVRSKDCGNSPKNRLTEDIAVALETSDDIFLKPLLDDDFVFHQSTEKSLNVDDFELGLGSISNEVVTLRVLRVVTHGRAGAVNGVSETKTGIKHFCYMFEFTNAKCNKIGAITAYVLGA